MSTLLEDIRDLCDPFTSAINSFNKVMTLVNTLRGRKNQYDKIEDKIDEIYNYLSDNYQRDKHAIYLHAVNDLKDYHQSSASQYVRMQFLLSARDKFLNYCSRDDGSLKENLLLVEAQFGKAFCFYQLGDLNNVIYSLQDALQLMEKQINMIDDKICDLRMTPSRRRSAALEKRQQKSDAAAIAGFSTSVFVGALTIPASLLTGPVGWAMLPVFVGSYVGVGAAGKSAVNAITKDDADNIEEAALNEVEPKISLLEGLKRQYEKYGESTVQSLHNLRTGQLALPKTSNLP